MPPSRRWRQVRGLRVPPAGRIAPWPTATRIVGPYAVIAMSRQRAWARAHPASWDSTACRCACIPHSSEPTQVVDSLILARPVSDWCGVLDHWTRHVPVQFLTVAELPTLWLLFERISVAMYELPLAVLTAIDLGHPQIERYGLILAAHVRLGPLKADPIADVASRQPSRESRTASRCRW